MSTAVATETGASPVITLPGGEFVLRFTSADAFVLDVQEGDGTSFADMFYDATTKVTIDSSSGPRSVKVPGRQSYRMDVGTYNSAITMTAYRIDGF
jgi:hypothetical protein